MAQTAYDLIGQILHPRPRSQAPAQPRPAAIPTEPVSVLIGRIIAPAGPPLLRAEPIAAAEPVPVVPAPPAQ